MKTLLLTTLLAATLSASAFAANPSPGELPGILKSSRLLRNVQAGVAADYKVPHCRGYKVTAYSPAEGKLKAEALCSYTDSSGDSTGVIIRVDGDFYDSATLIVSKIELVFAG